MVPQVAVSKSVCCRAKRRHEHGGERREPQAELVRRHRCRRGAVGEEVELLLFDPVLHLAAGAVDPLVEGLGVDRPPFQRGDDKPRVGALGQVLGLPDHPPPTAPAVPGAVAEVLVAAGRFAGLLVFVLGPGHGDGKRLDQPAVAGEAEDAIDPVRLAPRHQRLAGETAVSAKHDPDPRPTRADPRNDPPDFLDGAGRGVDVGAPELRREQVATAEDVKRQVAVAVVVTVEEAAFLVAVQRIVGGVEGKDDLLRRFGMRVEKKVDEEGFFPTKERNAT